MKGKEENLGKAPQRPPNVAKPEAPSLSGMGEKIHAQKKRYPVVDAHSPTYRDMHEPFNAMKYTNPRLPVDLGLAPVERIRECPNILRCILKWRDSEDVALPIELEPVRDLIMKIAEYDRIVNRNFKEQFMHLTVHNAYVDPGYTQRFPGWHGDDLQQGSFDPKVCAAHSYIVSSDPSTEFCLQPFFVAHLNDKRENVFDAFDQQAREENIYRTRPGHLYLMDPYSVHRSPVAEKPGWRTFFRITFSTHDMLMPRSTPNPLFADKKDPGDDAQHRDDWYWLNTPDTPICWHRYGLRENQS